MLARRIIKALKVILIVIIFSSCTKLLDVKPDKKLVIPASLEYLQALLDYFPTINERAAVAAEVVSDDYYLESDVWNSLYNESEQRMYIWAPDYIFRTPPNDWSNAYSVIYTTNTVLENIQTIKSDKMNDSQSDDIKGQALFIRGTTFYNLVSIFSMSYVEETANQDMGVPLRLNTNFNEKSERANLKTTYNQIVDDLKSAAILLPDRPIHVMRASRPAAYAQLARVYLSMREYGQALLYADSCLQMENELMDYNELDQSRTYPIPQFNKEVLYSSKSAGPPAPIVNTRAIVDSTLYSFYTLTDLRRVLFFKERINGDIYFTGGYDGSGHFFTGVATNEVYLIKAECLSRGGHLEESLRTINKLLQTRYQEGTFVEIDEKDPDKLLNIILDERRKELLMRTIRWTDIKRLNREGRNILLTRVINGEEYKLEPNDLRYALAIPEDIVTLAGIKQNIR